MWQHQNFYYRKEKMNIQLNIPTTWNQLSPNTLKKIAWYFHTNKKGKELDLLIYFAVLNIRWWQFKKVFNAVRLLKVVTITELKKHYSYVYKKLDLTTFIKIIKVKKYKLYAPGDRLHNISIDEFANCEDLHFQYIQSNNIDYLNYLTAVLYRKKINDEKISFNKNNLTEHAKLINKVSKKTLVAIALSYKGSSLEIQSYYPYVFKKVAVTKSNVSSKPALPGLGKLIQQMAGGKFGNLQETKQTNVHDFLAELNEQLKPKL